jgi:UDP-N-acetylmuramoyl-L-alanyl-D-glutamate--2,6-diaminopimelate ligase
VTSHGLAQNRLFGCNFKVGVITNVTHEHLDYHKTYQNYLQVKSKLFDHVQGAVLNRDDESFAYLNQKIKKSKTPIITYGLNEKADFNPQNFNFCPQLLGEHNQYNCLAAAAVTSFLGIDKVIIKKTLEEFKGVKGRMEEIKAGQDFTVFVDFAHTPNSLTNVLKTLKKITPKNKKLIAVFGSAGLRDRMKRPIMGENAAKYADIVVLTADDPRTEDVNKIIKEIASGCFKMGFEKDKNLFFIPNRQKAIEFALQKLAQKDDVLAFCGKGHEKSICYGKIDYPWSDQEVIKKVLKKNFYTGFVIHTYPQDILLSLGKTLLE